MISLLKELPSERRAEHLPQLTQQKTASHSSPAHLAEDNRGLRRQLA